MHPSFSCNLFSLFTYRTYNNLPTVVCLDCLMWSYSWMIEALRERNIPLNVILNENQISYNDTSMRSANLISTPFNHIRHSNKV